MAIKMIKISKVNKKIKIMHLNKRNGYFKNRIPEMHLLLVQYKPDILALSEANIDNTYLDYIAQFSPYNFELNKMFNKIGNSRNAILINNKIPYKRRYDLEDENTCTIWIEISVSKKKKLLFMGGYRQWNLPKNYDPENNKNSGPKTD